MTSVKDFFAGPMGIVTSAVAAVGVVFGLFNSLLTELVPPIDNSQQTVGFASLGTVIVLLVLSLLIRRKLTAVQTRTLAVFTCLLFLLAVLVYFPYRDFSRTYIYRYPPSSQAHSGQTLHIRGELHEKGRERVKGMALAEAVNQLGGPDDVNAMGILWTEDSRLKVISTLERYYVALIMLLTTALFSAALAVWRLQQPK